MTRQADERPATPGTGVKESAKVAVLFTSPQTVVPDIAQAMRLADYTAHLPRDVATALKINISWQRYYPACSTTPWQLEGVIRALQEDGYGELMPAQNATVVVDSHEGEVKNKHNVVLDRYGLKSVHLNDKDARWVRYQPKGEMLVLDKIFPDGIYLPEVLIGKNIIHLPTLKTHVFTTITGAMKNAFGGLLHFHRHWTHPVIHETLVDLLTIQKEIHPGVFAVLDGTMAGEGPGPRAMRVRETNVVLASADQVAIDAVAAKIMGFDPMSIRFIRLAHERGLGCGDQSEIEVVGADISQLNFGLKGGEDTLFSRVQKSVYWGPFSPVEKFLSRSFITPVGYLVSNLYHNLYWYNLFGRSRVKKALSSDWGKLFLSY